MDERLIQQQEQELAKTGRYYLHVCFMTIPLLCMACFLYRSAAPAALRRGAADRQSV